MRADDVEEILSTLEGVEEGLKARVRDILAESGMEPPTERTEYKAPEEQRGQFGLLPPRGFYSYSADEDEEQDRTE